MHIIYLICLAHHYMYMYCFACFISSLPPASFQGFKDWTCLFTGGAPVEVISIHFAEGGLKHSLPTCEWATRDVTLQTNASSCTCCRRDPKQWSILCIGVISSLGLLCLMSIQTAFYNSQTIYACMQIHECTRLCLMSAEHTGKICTDVMHQLVFPRCPPAFPGCQPVFPGSQC